MTADAKRERRSAPASGRRISKLFSHLSVQTERKFRLTCDEASNDNAHTTSLDSRRGICNEHDS